MARLGGYGKDRDEEIQNWPAKAKGTLEFDIAGEKGLSARVEVINESLDTIEPEHLEVVSTVQCLNMFPWEATFWFHRWLRRSTNSFHLLD